MADETTGERIARAAMTHDATLAAYVRARREKPDFPKDCCALALSALLMGCGVYDAMVPGAQGLANELEARGWTRHAAGTDLCEEGDAFVCADLNGNGLSDHVGLVLARFSEDPAGSFLAWDNNLEAHGGRPYVRNIGHGRLQFTPVAYWLRPPA